MLLSSDRRIRKADRSASVALSMIQTSLLMSSGVARIVKQVSNSTVKSKAFNSRYIRGASSFKTTAARTRKILEKQLEKTPAFES